MFKKLLIIAAAACMLLTGCDEELGEPEISVTDITPKNGYYYAVAEDCGDGCIYKSGTELVSALPDGERNLENLYMLHFGETNEDDQT